MHSLEGNDAPRTKVREPDFSVAPFFGMMNAHQGGRQREVLLHVQAVTGHAVHVSLLCLDKGLCVLFLQQPGLVDDVLNATCKDIQDIHAVHAVHAVWDT